MEGPGQVFWYSITLLAILGAFPLPVPPLSKRKHVTVQRALFSKRARQLVRRSTEMGAAVGGKGTVDTVRLRQTIINKLIDEGRGMAGSFPAPPAFLDDSFTSISLVNSKVGDSFIQDTLSMRCPMLRSIDMTGCFYVRDESIGVLLRRTPMVERFSIRNCRKLTDETLRHIVKHGKKIVALDIGGCFNMTAKGVDSFFKLHPNSPSLTELDISGISVTTQTLEILCKHCRSLEVLRMGFIEYMEDTLMQTLRPLVGNLRSIHVHWNTCITDGFLVWLAKSLPGLEDLNLCGCSHVSVDGVSDMLYDRQEALENDPSGKLSVIKKVNVRYATISKQDIEALEATFQGTKFG